MLIPKRHHKVPNQHDDHVRNHRRQPHLRLSDAFVLPRRAHADPIRQRPGGEKPNQRSDQDGKVHEADALGGEAVWRVGKDLRLRQVEGEEGRCRPRDDERGEFDDGEGEELPGYPQVEEDRLEWMGVWLEQLELSFVRRAFAEIRVTHCRGCKREIGHDRDAVLVVGASRFLNVLLDNGFFDMLHRNLFLRRRV